MSINVTIGGDIVREGGTVSSNDIEWSADGKTLTVNKDSKVLWASGSQTMTYEATMTTGEKISSGSVTFEVFDGVCVSDVDGDDGTTIKGTTQDPYKTIEKGITEANTLYVSGQSVPAQVRVAKGTYNLSSEINIVENISLYGGYSDNSSDNWGTTGEVSTITDTLTTGGSSGNPRTLIMSGSGITTATVIDGFTLIGGTGSYTTTIYCSDSSPTIQNNTINAGGDGSGEYRYAIYMDTNSAPKIYKNTINSSSSAGGISVIQSYGIRILASSPKIDDNNINAGTAGNSSGQNSYGIRVSDTTSNPNIINNKLDAGKGYNTYGLYLADATSNIEVHNNLILGGSTNSSGINYSLFLYNTSPIIRNNTIVCGKSDISSNSTYCLYLQNDSALTIVENNIFIFITGTGSYNSYAIYELTSTADISSLKNNDFFNFPNDSTHTIYHNENGASDDDWKTITDMETGLDSESLGMATGNTTADPALDPDYKFTVTSDSAVYIGGIDGGAAAWGFTTDRDRNIRTGNGTTGWSMGCYEFDGN